MDTTSPLYSIGGAGIFVEEVNRRVISGEVDIAVHSAKDLPSVLPQEIGILAVLERESPRDALISHFGLRELPRGAVIGTSSIRRLHELRNLRSDLRVENLRGNIDTRLRKLNEGKFDGIILAEAGIRRLGLEAPVHPLSEDDFLPSPNQGIIAVVGRTDSEYASAVRKISHEDTHSVMAMERKVITGLNLGCSLPAAILCTKTEIGYRIRCRFYSTSAREFKEFSRTFSSEGELDELISEIRRKVPPSYGYKFSSG